MNLARKIGSDWRGRSRIRQKKHGDGLRWQGVAVKAGRAVQVLAEPLP